MVSLNASQIIDIPVLRSLCLALYNILKTVLLGLLESNFLSSLFLDICPLSDVALVKIFSQSVGCHFSLLTVRFALQKAFSFIMSHISNVDLIA